MPPGYTSAVPATTLRLIDERLVPQCGTPDAEVAQRELRRRGLRPFVLRDGEDALSTALAPG